MSPQAHVWESISNKLDQSKRRPGFFGHWWSVLLTLLTLLLIGVGVYMWLKKSDSRSDKKQNRDLPYIKEAKSETGTANLNYLDYRTIPTTPKPTASSSEVSTPKRLIKTPGLKPDLSLNTTSFNNANPIIPLEISTNTVNYTEQEPTELSSLADYLDFNNGHDLIASSDSDFYSSKEYFEKTVSTLPLKELVLEKEEQKDHLSLLLDGCNVYRDDKTHFFIDLYYAPEIANRSLSTNKPELQSYVEERANSERPIISYSAGAKASVVFGNGLSVRAGLSYSSNTERFDYVKETQTIKKEIYDNNGQLVRTEFTELVIMDKSYNKYKYLDIPITVGYEKDLKDFIFSLNGGIGINLSANQSGKIYKDENNKMSFYSLENNGEANAPIFRNNAGLSLIGSVGLNYKYNQRLLLLLEPSARYYVRSLSDPSNPVSQNYLYLGLNIGLRYRIK
jgi:hypothetical protein